MFSRGQTETNKKKNNLEKDLYKHKVVLLDWENQLKVDRDWEIKW